MSLPFAIGGIPLRVMGESQLLQMAKAAENNDRVLIILQMHGGNDGLNALIPVEAYDLYQKRRPNIAIPAKNSLRKYIPLDTTLPTDAQIGLHPDMGAIKSMYDSGKVCFIQGVSYKNNSGSHFRGRDIFFMGGSSEDYYSSGWVGRYFEQTVLKNHVPPKVYPDDFPNDEMKDPLALEMGSDVSLIFHQEHNIPLSISLNDPASFAKLVEELEGFVDIEVDPRGYPPEFLKDTPYYSELDWILGLEDKSKDYAERLFEVWKAGNDSTVTYPDKYPFNAPRNSSRNSLSPQLKLIARLLGGGCKTRVFLVKIGGFDNHADQVEKYDTTMGAHAALLYHISSAMKAFQDDLRARGLEDLVLTVTTSEFGRRIASNGSYGTDHGQGGPVMVFGKGANPGVVGVVPDLNENNVAMQYDYRLVYSNIMRNWMGVSDQDMNLIFPGIMSAEGTSDGVKFTELPIAQSIITGAESFVESRFYLGDCFPNPARDQATFVFRINTRSDVSIELLRTDGKKAADLVTGVFEPGEHRKTVSLDSLAKGAYIYRLRAGRFHDAKKLIIR